MINLPNDWYSAREAMEIIFVAEGGVLDGTAETKATITRLTNRLRTRLNRAHAERPKYVQKKGRTSVYPNWFILTAWGIDPRA